MKVLTEVEIKKLGRLIPFCGICMRRFKQKDDCEWIADCKHYPDIVAHIGEKTQKKVGKKLQELTNYK